MRDGEVRDRQTLISAAAGAIPKRPRLSAPERASIAGAEGWEGWKGYAPYVRCPYAAHELWITIPLLYGVLAVAVVLTYLPPLLLGSCLLA